jgi:PEP-CTERM motif
MLRRVVHRIAMFAAIAGATAGMYTPCKGAQVLSTPAGLTAGDTFRFIFVTDGKTTATSSSISYYDNFASNQANGATYNGTTITWQAIGSTATVNAVAHIGSSTGGVFLASGTEVATSTTAGVGGLWSGTLLHAINQDLTSSNTRLTDVWTGTAKSAPFGHTSVNPLGDSVDRLSKLGYSDYTDSSWIATSDLGANYTLPFPVFGISEVLTVPSSVPEPSSALMAVLGIGTGLVLGWSRKGKESRRQGPAGRREASQ